MPPSKDHFLLKIENIFPRRRARLPAACSVSSNTLVGSKSSSAAAVSLPTVEGGEVMGLPTGAAYAVSVEFASASACIRAKNDAVFCGALPTCAPLIINVDPD